MNVHSAQSEKNKARTSGRKARPTDPGPQRNKQHKTGASSAKPQREKATPKRKTLVQENRSGAADREKKAHGLTLLSPSSALTGAPTLSASPTGVSPSASDFGSVSETFSGWTHWVRKSVDDIWNGGENTEGGELDKKEGVSGARTDENKGAVDHRSVVNSYFDKRRRSNVFHIENLDLESIDPDDPTKKKDKMDLDVAEYAKAALASNFDFMRLVNQVKDADSTEKKQELLRELSSHFIRANKMELEMLDAIKLKYTEQHAQLVDNGRNSLLKFIDSIEQFGRSVPSDRDAIIQHIEARTKTDRFRTIYNRLVPPDNLADLSSIRQYQKFRRQAGQWLKKLYAELNPAEMNLLDNFLNLNLIAERLKTQSEGKELALDKISDFGFALDEPSIQLIETRKAKLLSELDILRQDLLKTQSLQGQALGNLQNLLIANKSDSALLSLGEYVERKEAEAQVFKQLMENAAKKANPSTPNIPLGSQGVKALHDYLEAKHEEEIAMARLQKVANDAKRDVEGKVYELLKERVVLDTMPSPPLKELEAYQDAMRNSHSFVVKTLKALEPYIKAYNRQHAARESQHKDAVVDSFNLWDLGRY